MRVAGQPRTASGPAAHQLEHERIWRTLDVLVTAVADLRERAAIGAGLDPRSPHYSRSRKTFRGAMRHELELKARRALTSRSKLARAYYRTGRMRRRYRRSPAAALAMGIMRYPLTLLRTVAVTLALIVLILWMVYTLMLVPIVGAITPSSLADRGQGGGVMAAGGSPTCQSERRKGGVEGGAWALADAARRAAEAPVDAERIRGRLFEAAAGAGRAVGTAREALEGSSAPMETVEPALYAPTAGGSCAPCPSSGTATPDLEADGEVEQDLPLVAAKAVLATSWSDEPAEVQEIAVAVAQGESSDKPDARNPKVVDGSRAHGLWQIMLPMHEDKWPGLATEWADPRVNAYAAFEIYEEAREDWRGKRGSVEDGFGPWDVFRSGAYKAHLPAARAALKVAAGDAPDPVLCAVVGSPSVMAASAGAAGGGDLAARGYSNGAIPARELCPPSWTLGMLHCDAAASLEQLNAAYAAHFGRPMELTDTYRDLAGQYACTAAKGDACAVPGTSNHGWGVAVDFGGGINTFGTRQHEWMRQHAGRFGWVHPAWAQRGGSKPEAWHWEFVQPSRPAAAA